MRIESLEALLAEIAASESLAPEFKYVYAEVGKYKPFSTSTISAAKRRGYRVVMKAKNVFYIFPKESQ